MDLDYPAYCRTDGWKSFRPEPVVEQTQFSTFASAPNIPCSPFYHFRLGVSDTVASLQSLLPVFEKGFTVDCVSIVSQKMRVGVPGIQADEQGEETGR